MQRYIIEAFGDGPDFQLGVHGPFKSEAERERAADQIKRETEGDSRVFRLNVRKNGRADFPVG
jgi:hypothetical protein